MPWGKSPASAGGRALPFRARVASRRTMWAKLGESRARTLVHAARPLGLAGVDARKLSCANFRYFVAAFAWPASCNGGGMIQRWFTPRTALVRPRTARLLGAVALFALTPACMLEKQDDAEEYREAVPQREAVVVAGPET